MNPTDSAETAAVASSDPVADRVQALLAGEIDRLVAYFSRRTDPSHEAADLAAETLLIVWRRASSVPVDGTQARMWLYGVARKVLQSHHRRRRKQLALADRLRDDLRAGGAQRGVHSGHDVRGDEVAAIRALVHDLPERDRDIIMLRHWDGFTLAEIATLLKIPAATVRSRYHRARKRLHAELLQQ